MENPLNPINDMLRENPAFSGMFDNPLFFIFLAWLVLIGAVMLYMKKKIKPDPKEKNDENQ